MTDVVLAFIFEYKSGGIQGNTCTVKIKGHQTKPHFDSQINVYICLMLTVDTD